jgi:hypothetical protein
MGYEKQYTCIHQIKSSPREAFSPSSLLGETGTAFQDFFIFKLETSREGLRQVYDGMYKFLSVTNFGSH